MLHDAAYNKGFSLIELMIVILIIGISTSMAMLYIDNSDERLQTEARRILAMAQLLRDDAIISGEVSGLVIENRSYYFTQLEQGKWVERGNKPFKRIKLEDDIKIRTLITGDQIIKTNEQEQTTRNLIYFLPTGESSEFQIWISTDNSEYVLTGSLMGQLTLKKSES